MNNGELDARVKLAKVTSDYTQLFIAVLKSIKAKDSWYGMQKEIERVLECLENKENKANGY